MFYPHSARCTKQCSNSTVHNVLKLLCVQLSGIIHSTQSCIFDVKAWMIDNKMRLNFDKTEMILIAPYRFLSSDSVPQSVNLDGCDIKLSNTARNLGASLDPTWLFRTANLSVCLSVAYNCGTSPDQCIMPLFLWRCKPKNVVCVRSFKIRLL